MAKWLGSSEPAQSPCQTWQRPPLGTCSVLRGCGRELQRLVENRVLARATERTIHTSSTCDEHAPRFEAHFEAERPTLDVLGKPPLRPPPTSLQPNALPTDGARWTAEPVGFWRQRAAVVAQMVPEELASKR